MTARVGWSLIVPSRDGADTLPDCLAALARLAAPASGLEIILVDNASTDATAKLMRDFAAAAGADVRVRDPRHFGIVVGEQDHRAAAASAALRVLDEALAARARVRERLVRLLVQGLERAARRRRAGEAGGDRGPDGLAEPIEEIVEAGRHARDRFLGQEQRPLALVDLADEIAAPQLLREPRPDRHRAARRAQQDQRAPGAHEQIAGITTGNTARRACARASLSAITGSA